jgi:hypothetical protein
MGKALRDLRIPIGNVLSSPTYRALETVRLAQFGAPQTFVELGDNGQSMQGGTAAQAEWLRKQLAHFRTGTNTIVATHCSLTLLHTYRQYLNCRYKCQRLT